MQYKENKMPEPYDKEEVTTKLNEILNAPVSPSTPPPSGSSA